MASSQDAGLNLGSIPSARRPSGAGLLLFDLDDTIVQSGSHVSQRVIKALVAAHEAGWSLSVASGRPLCSVQRKILDSGSMDYAVCSNGATLTRLSDGKVMSAHLMTRQDALRCHELLSPFHPAWNAFFGGNAYFEWKGTSYMLTGRTGAMARSYRGTSGRGNPMERLARIAWRGCRFAWRMLTNRSHRQVRSVLPHLQRAVDGVEKMGCSIPDAAACALAAERLRADGRFEVVQMGGTELEITAKGVTKGMGIRSLLQATGIDPLCAVAFGDSQNDLPMADAVGRFVAMGNADDEVKAEATEVCGTVGEDGVAIWIERNLLDS